MDFFDIIDNKNIPLAERMRCKTLDDFIGQEHIVGKDTLLRRAIKIDKLGSCIFYGPAGVGKTTLANIIANSTNSYYEYLNAVTNGVGDAKKVIEEAKSRLKLYGKKTYLFLDECHRWNKAQSDSVLSAIEKGEIIFIGSTTENPFVSMTKAIVSRCRIFEFRKLNDNDIVKGLEKAIKDKANGYGEYNIDIDNTALKHIAFMANGDMRNALNALELAFLTTNADKDGKINITLDIAEQSTQKRAISVDDSLYYDIISAYCKSLRGSDPDAAVYYADRLLNAGCDPMLICRRLIVHSAEDVGMADPYALTISVSAMQAMEKIGLPEGKIPLFEAIIYVACAEKSNSVVKAIYALNELSGYDDKIPDYLRDQSFKAEKSNGYKYPHDYKGNYVEQQYLPDSLKDIKLYEKGENGFEGKLKLKKSK